MGVYLFGKFSRWFLLLQNFLNQFDLMVSVAVQTSLDDFLDSMMFCGVVCVLELCKFFKMLEEKSFVGNAAVLLKSLSRNC